MAFKVSQLVQGDEETQAVGREPARDYSGVSFRYEPAGVWFSLACETTLVHDWAIHAEAMER